METELIISEFFDFLIILKEAIKIIPKNGKLTASLSLLLPSIFFLSFSHLCRQYLLTVMYIADGPDSGHYENHPPLVAIALLLVYLVISHASVIAAILVASATCTGKSKDLFTSMLKTISHVSRQKWTNNIHCLFFIIFFFQALLIVFAYPDIFTISSAIVFGAVIIDFLVYSSSDVWALSLVVLVLEDEEGTSSFCCSEAMEKLGDVVEGHELKGAMLDFFNTLLFIIVCILVWVFKYQNPTLCGLIFVNALSIMKMVLFMAYTLLYFQCKNKNKHPAAGDDEICSDGYFRRF